MMRAATAAKIASRVDAIDPPPVRHLTVHTARGRIVYTGMPDPTRDGTFVYVPARHAMTMTPWLWDAWEAVAKSMGIFVYPGLPLALGTRR